MKGKILLGFILMLVIIVFIAAYWATETQRQEAARQHQTTEAVAVGAGLYASACVSCHGADGEGGIGPALMGTQLDSETLEKIISRGVPGTAMSAWGQEEGGALKEHQIKDLATFIKNWEALTK
jgi:mono/diheme cytochrome c family protein